MRIALVLGGGGAVGHAYHATVLSALYRVTGWDPRQADLIVGTSAGSGIASLLRGGIAPADVLERILDTPKLDDSTAVPGALPDVPPRAGLRLPFPQAPGVVLSQLTRLWKMNPLLLGSSLLPRGRIDTVLIGQRGHEIFGDRWPDQKLWVVAVELASGRRVVFGRDDIDPAVPVGKAVEASCAIPGYFRPVRINGKLHMDGGAYSPTNADLIVDAGPWDLVIALAPLAGSTGAAVSTFPPLYREAFRRALESELRPLTDAGVPTLLFYPSMDEARVMGSNLLDSTRRVPVVLQSGAEALRTLADPGQAAIVDMLRTEARLQRLHLVETGDSTGAAGTEGA